MKNRLALFCSLISLNALGFDISECRFESLPTISMENDNKIFVFLEKDKPIFWQEVLPMTWSLNSLRNFVMSQTNVDQSYLLRKQQAIFNSRIPDMGDLDQLFSDLAEQKIGGIKSISCLEALLFDLHLTTRGIEKPTEFCAAIYKIDISGTTYIKVILSSGPEASGPDMTSLLAQENRPVFAFMHNHFFAFDNNTGDIAGTVIPSGLMPPYSFFEPASDLKYYRQIAQTHGLKQAWITNGFHTSHFDILDRTGQGYFWIY